MDPLKDKVKERLNLIFYVRRVTSTPAVALD